MLSLAAAASVVYLSAEAIIRAGHSRPRRVRRPLLAAAVALTVVAAGIVVASEDRDVVLGFVVGGVLTPIIVRLARHRRSSTAP